MATPTIALAKVDAQKRVIPKGDPRKAHWWRLTLGKKITGGGKKRKFFCTEREAKTHFEAIAKRAVEEGHQAFEIPYKLRLEAMKCEELLQPHGVSLTEAVGYYLYVLQQAGLATPSVEACLRTLGFDQENPPKWSQWTSFLTWNRINLPKEHLPAWMPSEPAADAAESV